MLDHPRARRIRSPGGIAQAFGRAAQIDEQRKIQFRQSRDVCVRRLREVTRTEQPARADDAPVRAAHATEVSKVDDAFQVHVVSIGRVRSKSVATMSKTVSCAPCRAALDGLKGSGCNGISV